ncbi:MAG: DUF2591 family protein [Novosphingobium sp.]|nr:DUF2591 family protein [Novosphingobium sp.]
MRTADLTGAILDWHTARAEGVPAADMELRANGTLCVRNIRGTPGKIVAVQVLDYSTNWALSGPLVEKHMADVECHVDPVRWVCSIGGIGFGPDGVGDTPLIAICRAVVRAAFGDDVEDLPC